MAVNFVNLFTEFIGSFIFITIILRSGDPWVIGAALIALIKFAQGYSGGHYNPIVSLALAMRKSIPMSFNDVIVYVLAQSAGAIAATTFVNSTSLP
jgi:glycerol uptake facilitator-like aquaporin